MRRVAVLLDQVRLPRHLQVGLALTLGLICALMLEPEALEVPFRPHSVHSEHLQAAELGMSGQLWQRQPVLAEFAANAEPMVLETPQIEETVPLSPPTEQPESMVLNTSAAVMTYRGRMQRRGVGYVFVDTGQGVHAMAVGDSLEDGWRLDRITPERIELSNPRLGQTHQLPSQ